MLVPNEAGLARALAAGVDEIAVFGSSTETFARRNLAQTLDGQFEMFAPVVAAARERGMRVRGYLSMCFGDPWEGRVPVAQVVSAGMRLLELGCTEICLGDTIGVGTAGQVDACWRRSGRPGSGSSGWACTSTTPTARRWPTRSRRMRRGVTTIDSSAGGLGGCPYAKSATGNLATEDLVWLLTGLGIEHGVDLDALVATSVWLAGQLGRPSPSAVVRALGGGAG